MRLFIGIPLAKTLIDALERVSHSLRSAGDDLRWSSPESWHITLQFLGETSLEEYACLVSRLDKVAPAAVPVRFAELGFFERAGVFFADVDVSPALHDLRKQVTAATAQCGFIAEDRPFHPHVTLARAKGGNKVGTLRKLKSRITPGKTEFPAFTATEFLLYEAFLGPGGSRYEIRERFRLPESSNP